MATASKVFKDVKIKLEMTALEAAVLHAILQRIGGNPDTTLRGVTSGINDALNSVLVYNLWDCVPVGKVVNERSVFYPIHQSLKDSQNGLSFNTCTRTREGLEADIQFHLANV